MKKENLIIEVEEDKFCNYESKIKYIVKNDRFELQTLKDDDAKIQYFINHFIMSDFDCKQLELYLHPRAASRARAESHLKPTAGRVRYGSGSVTGA
jgi:hypothetical protein